MKGKMNKLKMKAMILLSFLLATLPLPMASVALVGCTSGCRSVAEGSDPVVVRAEQAADISFEIMDAYLSLEENNREYLRTVSPEFEKAAIRVRTDGKAAIENLRSATKTYKQNRTPENKANITTWLATVEEIRRIAAKYITTVKVSNPPPAK